MSARRPAAGATPAELANWSGSHHDLAMQHASDATILGDFDNAEFTYGGITTTFSKHDGKFFVRTDGADGSLQDFEVRFAFGVAPLQQYLLELPGGRLQALSIAWDSRKKEDGGQRWFHLYPDETIAHGDPLHWTGLQQNWNFMCAECHSTDLQRGYDPATNSYKTTFSEINVACESCHGPGSRHVAWAKHEPGWEAIDRQGARRPSRRAPRRHLDFRSGDRQQQAERAAHHDEGDRDLRPLPFAPRSDLGEDRGRRPDRRQPPGHRCSTTGLYFPDGQIRDEVYEYGSFLQSKMFHEGVTCSDCHDPHSLKLRAEGSGVCLQCHGAEKFATPAHHHHEAASKGAECVSCHMPERTYMVVDARRDHSFRIPRPDLSVSLGTPNACTGCHTDKDAAWAAATVKSLVPDAKSRLPGFRRAARRRRGGSTRRPRPAARLRQ